MFGLTSHFLHARAAAGVIAFAAIAGSGSASLLLAAAPSPAAAAATSLVYRIDAAQVKATWLQFIQARVRRILINGKIGHGGVTIAEGQIRITLKDPSKSALAISRLKTLAQPLPDQPPQLTVISREGGLIVIEPTLAGMQNRQEHAIRGTIQGMQRRLDLIGVPLLTVAADGEDRILIRVPGLEAAEVKMLLGNRLLIDAPPRLTFQLTGDAMTPGQAMDAGVPPGDELVPDAAQAGRLYLLHKEAAVSGYDLLDVTVGEETKTGKFSVNLEFNQHGAAACAHFARENIGKRLAVVLDGKVISVPVIHEEFATGRVQITGGFSREEANRLAILLRSGALPVPLILVEERSGPSPGADPPGLGGKEGK